MRRYDRKKLYNNNKALIEHDAIIKDHCHISTNSTINGEVVVNKTHLLEAPL